MQLRVISVNTITMGNNNSKTTDEQPKYPLSNIEPLTSNNSFPKPKKKKRFRINLKIRRKAPVTHVSFKPLNEDRSSLIFPEGVNLSGNVKDKQDETNGSTTSLRTQPVDRADDLKSQTPTSEDELR